MNSKEMQRLVSEAIPTCGVNDSSPEGRYRIWLDNPVRVIKARTKKELFKKLIGEGKTLIEVLCK